MKTVSMEYFECVAGSVEQPLLLTVELTLVKPVLVFPGLPEQIAAPCCPYWTLPLTSVLCRSKHLIFLHAQQHIRLQV